MAKTTARLNEGSIFAISRFPCGSHGSSAPPQLFSQREWCRLEQPCFLDRLDCVHALFRRNLPARG